MFYRVVYKYWKITLNDMVEAQKSQYKGIEIHIDGSGALWKMGEIDLKIVKGSPEWLYLTDHIMKLDSFIRTGENTNSKNIPKILERAKV